MNKLRPPTLIMTGGPDDGAVVTCEETGEIKRLGSGSQAEVCIPLDNVSEAHAQLEWDGQQLLLQDTGSATGTYVNGEKIAERRALVEGDRIYLGPPGSPDSASLLVCPPAEAAGDVAETAEAAPAGSAPEAPLLEEAEPLVLETDAEPVVPALDLLAPPPEIAGSPTAEMRAPESPPAPAPPAPVTAEPAAPPSAPDRPAKLTAPPMDMPAPSPPPRASPATSTTAARKIVKPDYTSDMPSIVSDRVREPISLPPVKRTVKPVRRSTLPQIPRAALIGGATALLGALAVGAYLTMHTPPPVLLSVSPPKLELGGTLTISGEKLAGEAKVFFGEQAGEVLSATETQITSRVPEGAKLGDAPVTVETAGGRSNSLFCKLFLAPKTATLTPDVALPGEEVVLGGAHLNIQTPVINVGGLNAEVLDAKPTAVRFRIPPDLPVVEGRTVQVTVQVGAETAKPIDLILGRLPLLSQIEPTSGAPGDRLTLRGRGFAPEPSGNVVMFGDRRAVVASASANELTVAVVGSESAGGQLTVPVQVTVAGSASSPSNFQLIRSSAGFYAPRFYPLVFADHPGHEHVFVASDMGPLLVLTGQGAPERALGVADGLNRLFDSAVAGQPAAVEAREKPAPCMAVRGAPDCLITATAEDAAGYDEPWSSAKGARAHPRALAGHWTALVEDFLALFVRKQRPYRILETSLRGKILLELYGEAVRRVGAGNGVPTGLVSPLSTRLAAELKDMALVLPAEAQAKGAAAIEGVWTGKVDEPSASRNVTVAFRVQRSKLAGTLSTRVGPLTMDTPLENLSYERSAIRFSARLAGELYDFKGALQEGQISGSIHPEGGTETIGTFQLSFVE